MKVFYELFGNIISFFHGITGNYGIDIILLTILVKVVLFPLNLKQYKSMNKMKELQPELEKYKKLYGHDQALLQQKTMELYKEKGANPLSGCLPLLIQLPILWALYGVLRADQGIIKDTSFLWMTLLKPDPYYVLPVLNGVLAFIQQKMNGTSGNKEMEKMMYIFPIMMVFISYKLPAGLQIYWFVSSLLSVIQQYVMMRLHPMPENK